MQYYEIEPRQSKFKTLSVQTTYRCQKNAQIVTWAVC